MTRRISVSSTFFFFFFLIVSWSTCCSSSDRGWATDALIEWNRWRRRKNHLSTNGSCWKTPHRTTTWRSACKFLIVFLEFDVVLIHIYMYTHTLYIFLCVFSVLEDESTRLSAVELKYFIITGLKSLYGEVRPWRPVRSQGTSVFVLLVLFSWVSEPLYNVRINLH